MTADRKTVLIFIIGGIVGGFAYDVAKMMFLKYVRT